MKRFFVVLAGLVLTGFSVLAQEIRPTGTFVFNVDYARFLYSPTETYFEIYYAFYPRLIAFQREGERYRGAILITTSLTNTGTGEAVISQRSLLPVSVADTSEGSFHRTFVTHAGYAVPHGSYELQVVAQDTTMPQRRDTLRSTVTLAALGTGMTASDIELCSNITNSTNANDIFYKNSLEVIPNPTQVFGVANYPVLFYYLELYNVLMDTPLDIRTLILDARGNTVRESAKKKTFKVASSAEAGMMNVSSIESGKYLLRISITNDAGQTVSTQEKPFFIYNPHIQAVQLSASDLISTELAGLTADELDIEFNQAQYVATSQDIALYGKLTSADAKRQFLANFWAEVEEGKPGRIIITRREYLQRVSATAERFRAFTRPGWKTDRGRVFILYAEPDQIDRVPSSDFGKPHETWHYYQIENGVQFVFIDRTGFGEYSLVHSTKRGELQDDNWQRLLQ